MSDGRWPRDAQAIGMVVKRLTPQLAQRGVRIERHYSGETAENARGDPAKPLS